MRFCTNIVIVCVRMSSLSEQLQALRHRAEVCLYSGGRLDDLWLQVTDMAKLPLPPCIKYRHVAAETMVIHNSVGSDRKEVTRNDFSCFYDHS